MPKIINNIKSNFFTFTTKHQTVITFFLIIVAIIHRLINLNIGKYDLYCYQHIWLLQIKHSLITPYMTTFLNGNSYANSLYHTMDYGFAYALYLKMISTLFIWHSSVSVAATNAIYKLTFITPFEIIMCVVLFKLIRNIQPSWNKQNVLNIVLLAVLLNPTFFFSSVIWGQADTMMATLMLLIFYNIYKGNYKTAFVVLGCSMAFKLTYIYIVPALIIYMFIKKVSFKGFFIAFATAFAFAIPFLVQGLPLSKMFNTFIVQTQQSWLWNSECSNHGLSFILSYYFHTPIFIGKVICTLVATFLCFVSFILINNLFYKNKHITITPYYLAILMAFFGTALPFLLPQQYARFYTVLAVISIIILAIYRPKLTWLAILIAITQFFSVSICYTPASRFYYLMIPIIFMPILLLIIYKLWHLLIVDYFKHPLPPNK